jgi:hypothetical protein
VWCETGCRLLLGRYMSGLTGCLTGCGRAVRLLHGSFDGTSGGGRSDGNREAGELRPGGLQGKKKRGDYKPGR